MKLNKRYFRSIRDNLSFYVSSTVLTVVTLILFYLFHIAGTGINQFGDTFFEKNHLEDGEFSTYMPIPDEKISELEEKYNIQLEAQNYVNIKEEDYTARVFSSTKKINLYEITVGEDISADGEIIISEGYADYMNVEIGDEIILRDTAYEVVGYFQRPDYLYMLEQPDDSYKNISTFFLAYLSENDFEQLGEIPVQYFIKYNTDNQLEVRKAIHKEYSMMNYLSAEDNPRISMVHEQADMFIQMSYIMLVIMPLIAVALICIILGRKVKSEQKLIGTLSALGYKKSTLMLHYAGFAAIPGLLGGIFSYAVSAIFAQPYGEMGLSDYEPMRAEFSLSPAVGLLGIVIPTVMYIVAAFLAVYRLLKNDTITLLSGAVGEKKSTRKLFVKSRMPVRKKFAFRSLIGNPARSLVVLLGVFLGSFIMLFSFAVIDSINSASDNTASQIGSYKYEYILNSIKTEEPEEGAAILMATFEDENQKSIPMYGIGDENPYLNLKDKNGNAIVIGNGYYVTSVTSAVLGMEAGDTVTLYSPITLEKSTVEIDGVIDNDMQTGIFTARPNVEKLTGLESGSYNALMSGRELNINESEIAKMIKTSALAEQCDTMLDQMGAMIYLLVLLGAIICVAAIYVAVNMMMTENRNNISMLKVLGYNDKRINAMVLNANHILLPIGILISIPVVYLTFNVYMKWLASYVGMIIQTVISPKSFVITIAVTSICYFGSVFLIRRKTKKINMVESLKDNRE